ncbi:hypothetical protein BKI52_04930 [marine bacterium AO1-C]|nr:hypothetical protein BKI52_04930 [marine bacterium AO1-C]
MKKNWSWYLLFFLFMGILIGGASAYFYQAAGKDLSTIYLISKQVTFWLLWFVMYQPVYVLTHKINQTKYSQKFRLGLQISASLVIVFFHYVFYFLLWYYTIIPGLGLSKEYGPPIPIFLVNIPDTMVLSFIIYGAIVLARYVSNYYKKYKEEELKSIQTAEKLAQAELRALKMQLHPHFLFNTLHAISALMHKDIIIAEKMINRLSELLRYSLKNTGQQLVSLRQELEFLELYLEIEKVRFQGRLKVNLHIDSRSLDAEVPHLILQPLVENALKHGIAPQAKGGIITITAQQVKETLLLKVYDNGKSMTATHFAHLKEGIGLENTRLRLHQLYDNKHKFQVDNCQGKGFEVSIDIPLKILQVNEYQSINS